ncbi:MAG: hypothetical protein NZZ41_07600, partial [Candidatus Dojkabacteria bacterium]|nr:hypothetical protein [Candidatus Dojkabacteria bacterium]
IRDIAKQESKSEVQLIYHRTGSSDLIAWFGIEINNNNKGKLAREPRKRIYVNIGTENLEFRAFFIYTIVVLLLLYNRYADGDEKINNLGMKFWTNFDGEFLIGRRDGIVLYVNERDLQLVVRMLDGIIRMFRSLLNIEITADTKPLFADYVRGVRGVSVGQGKGLVSDEDSLGYKQSQILVEEIIKYFAQSLRLLRLCRSGSEVINKIIKAYLIRMLSKPRTVKGLLKGLRGFFQHKDD